MILCLIYNWWKNVLKILVLAWILLIAHQIKHQLPSIKCPKLVDFRYYASDYANMTYNAICVICTHQIVVSNLCLYSKYFLQSWHWILTWHALSVFDHTYLDMIANWLSSEFQMNHFCHKSPRSCETAWTFIRSYSFLKLTKFTLFDIGVKIRWD